MKSITIKNNDLIEKINKNGIENLIKPLQKEIFLTDIYLSGIIFSSTASLSALKQGDSLTLQRVNTKYDDFTVNVLTEKNEHVGEINEFYNAIFARLMDAGKKITAKVKRIVVNENRNVLLISVYLIDF